MNKPLINEVNELKYVVKVNGKVISRQFTSSQQAETFLSTLNESDQSIAQIVPVDTQGREVLLG